MGCWWETRERNLDLSYRGFLWCACMLHPVPLFSFEIFILLISYFLFLCYILWRIWFYFSSLIFSGNMGFWFSEWTGCFDAQVRNTNAVRATFSLWACIFFLLFIQIFLKQNGCSRIYINLLHYSSIIVIINKFTIGQCNTIKV